MNKTVSRNEISGFNLIVKTVANSKLLGQVRLTGEYDENADEYVIEGWNPDTHEVIFDLSKNKKLFESLAIGQYYKIQLAYIDSEGVIGYYSSVAIVKYTSEPSVTIEGLEFGIINMDNGTYVGGYSQQSYEIVDGKETKKIIRDTTERAYNYVFNIYDSDNQLVETSGECLHNSFEDTDVAYSRDIYTLKKDLEMNKSYYIQYIVTTNNNLVKKSNKYRIMNKETIDPEIYATVEAEMKPDDGYIEVKLKGIKDEYDEYVPSYGTYLLKRACSKDGYGTWNTVYNFRLNGQLPQKWSWKDCTVEHGYTYQYAIQQYNENGLFSNKLFSNEVYCHFEDSFLFDGERQLKIRFNPKISSFKNVVLETKTDTIGSKYPFIFRNGNVYYKEFPISGLISYMMDENELFIKKENIQLEEITFNLTNENILSERLFKQEVHTFLNDGKPKIFRSSTEGSFIVRLLNVSLSPQDSLGRMLHTFSATAYEVDEFDYDSLVKYGFITVPELNMITTHWETVFLSDPITGEDKTGEYDTITKKWIGKELLKYKPATSILIQDATPGDKFIIEYQEKKNKYIKEEILIGPTGVYRIELVDGLLFYSVKSSNKTGGAGSLIYSYESELTNVFNTILDVKVHDFQMQQYFGKLDILKEIEDVKKHIIKFNYLRFSKRPVYNLYTKDKSTLYWDRDCKQKVDKLEFTFVYEVTLLNNNSIYYLDGRYPLVPINSYGNKIILNGNEIDITETEGYDLMDLTEVTELKIDLGVALDCSYQLKEITYTIERTNTELRRMKSNYDTNYNNLLRLLNWNEEDGVYFNSDLNEQIIVDYDMVEEYDNSIKEYYIFSNNEYKSIDFNSEDEFNKIKALGILIYIKHETLIPYGYTEKYFSAVAGARNLIESPSLSTSWSHYINKLEAALEAERKASGLS